MLLVSTINHCLLLHLVIYQLIEFATLHFLCCLPASLYISNAQYLRSHNKTHASKNVCDGPGKCKVPCTSTQYWIFRNDPVVVLVKQSSVTGEMDVLCPELVDELDLL